MLSLSVIVQYTEFYAHFDWALPLIYYSDLFYFLFIMRQLALFLSDENFRLSQKMCHYH